MFYFWFFPDPLLIYLPSNSVLFPRRCPFEGLVVSFITSFFLLGWDVNLTQKPQHEFGRGDFLYGFSPLAFGEPTHSCMAAAQSRKPNKIITIVVTIIIIV